LVRNPENRNVIVSGVGKLLDDFSVQFLFIDIFRIQHRFNIVRFRILNHVDNCFHPDGGSVFDAAAVAHDIAGFSALEKPDQSRQLKMLQEILLVLFIQDNPGNIADNALGRFGPDRVDDIPGCAVPFHAAASGQIQSDRTQGLRVGKQQRLHGALEVFPLFPAAFRYRRLRLHFRGEVGNHGINHAFLFFALNRGSDDSEPSPAAFAVIVPERRRHVPARIDNGPHRVGQCMDIIRMNVFCK